MRAFVTLGLAGMLGCGAARHPTTDPDAIDRFSSTAAHLLVRDATHPLPAAGAPIDLDRPPFVTQGLAPDGSVVRYYNFDVQSPVPGVIHAYHSIDVLPGDPGYSDFWIDEATHQLIDCPIVPPGTTAREGQPQRRELTYRGHAVMCLQFGEPLTPVDGRVPTSPIYVTFAKEGFRREGDTPQTHNVVFSLPGDTDYSPLWAVQIYDVRAFDLVHDEGTARRARIVKQGPLVNCPIVAAARR